MGGFFSGRNHDLGWVGRNSDEVDEKMFNDIAVAAYNSAFPIYA